MITCAQIDSKQAYLVKIRNVWLFFSYNTLVCIINADKFYETDIYHSITTNRHIKEFINKYSSSSRKHIKVENIEMLANQLLFESTKEMVVAHITD